MHILVDQDGVLANFEQAMYDTLTGIYPADKLIPLDQRRNHRFRDDYTGEMHETIEEIMMSEGFYRNLPVMPGALRALLGMEQAGHEVTICTSPLVASLYCASEKLDWIRAHLGLSWVKKTVITYDKTVVRGDFLIDDKPAISGGFSPDWEHIVFDAPYNRSAPSSLRLGNWDDWSSVIHALNPHLRM